MVATYVINLKRSTERMESMRKALESMNVDYERIEGVDAQFLSDELLSKNASPSIEYPYELTKGELACFFSHRRCWERLVNSKNEWALILEDHCEFSKKAMRYMTSTDWVPPECELVQLIYSEKSFYTTEEKYLNDGNCLMRLTCSSAVGASAYFISKKTAMLALKMSEVISEPTDNFLFGPWSEFSNKVPCWRLLGGVVRRKQGIRTTIAGRNAKRKFYFKKRFSLSRLVMKAKMMLVRRSLRSRCQYWLN